MRVQSRCRLPWLLIGVGFSERVGVYYSLFCTSQKIAAMQTKLTLRLDDQLIRDAKHYARRSGKSLSQMVAEYFSAVTSPDVARGELTPTVSRLNGALVGTNVDREHYRRYLEGKHPTPPAIQGRRT